MRVIIAELQSAISIPGTKVLGAVTLNTIKYPELRMDYTAGASILDGHANGKSFAIPITNVKFMVYGEGK